MLNIMIVLLNMTIMRKMVAKMKSSWRRAEMGKAG